MTDERLEVILGYPLSKWTWLTRQEIDAEIRRLREENNQLSHAVDLRDDIIDTKNVELDHLHDLTEGMITGEDE